jgi:hypothetical protein
MEAALAAGLVTARRDSVPRPELDGVAEVAGPIPILLPHAVNDGVAWLETRY